MTDLEVHFIGGLVCDRCKARREIALTPRWGAEARAFRAAAAADGWTRWRSRSTRDYCPACAPSPGHQMRRLQ